MNTGSEDKIPFNESSVAAISDNYMQQMIAKTKNYCIVILKATPKRKESGMDKIVWEHGRRNFALRNGGLLPIVCPVTDASEVSGIGIFDLDLEQTKKIMDQDPGVQVGIFTYEIYTCRSFPGSKLPE
jgi:hypothetical protein